MKMPIRVMLVEDNEEYRDVIKFALNREEDLELFSQFGTAEMAISSIGKIRSKLFPQVILLDMRLPGMSGLEAIPHFQECLPEVKIIILTQSDAEADVVRAIALGASGYLLKSATVQQVNEAIRTVMQGGASLDPKVAAYIVKSLRERPVPTSSKKLLSDRETQVLELLADGLQKREIAEQLHISYPTVDAHVRHIYEKLDVRNAPSAVRTAYRMGIFDSDEWI
ncbi:response regulator transcription factor [Coraliomargarita sp. SDUM461003]|uniref:Response regulator transcription factor n=1 Tax=Thalassobacterium maritimum TaxID=3041265 RepID=A0ABU1ATQ8_9BACT|nr:response regulator transcription factor [Coraliomargarita sp. SDUM461003]MDQ8207533.1 response regulator transcription factor [Coraliomargarita sp. SDUM461003]